MHRLNIWLSHRASSKKKRILRATSMKWLDNEKHPFSFTDFRSLTTSAAFVIIKKYASETYVHINEWIFPKMNSILSHSRVLSTRVRVDFLRWVVDFYSIFNHPCKNKTWRQIFNIRRNAPIHFSAYNVLARGKTLQHIRIRLRGYSYSRPCTRRYLFWQTRTTDTTNRANLL